MSTSLLYHAYGLRGYREQSIDFEDGSIRLLIAQNPDTPMLLQLRLAGGDAGRGGVASLALAAHRLQAGVDRVGCPPAAVTPRQGM